MATPTPRPDEYEPDDTQYEASPFTVNDLPQRHNFHIAGDEDWVKFWGWAGNEYTIRTFDLDDGNDTVLCLYDAHCNELTCNDDDPNNPPASRIVWPVSKNGTYFVQAVQWVPIGWNLAYSLSITDTVSCKDQYEPDDTCDEADEIVVGESQEHNFHDPCGGDEDWVKFRAVAGHLYTIKTFELSDGNDTMLQLYNSDGGLEAQNDDDQGCTSASRIDFTPPITRDGEFFFVRAAPFYTTAGGCDLEYFLKVTERAGTSTPSPTPTTTPTCADRFEPDNARHEATSIIPNDPPQEDRNFHVAGDVDWVKFWAWAGNVYTIRTFDLGGGNNTTLGLYNVRCNELAFNDDGGDPDGPLASKIVFTATEKGSYFVKVAHVKPSIGGCSLTYSLEVMESIPCRDKYEPDDTPDEVLDDEVHQIIVNGPPQEHNFHVPCFNDYHRPDTEDWAWFEAEAGYTYTIRTLNLGGGNDTELCLYTGSLEEPDELPCNDDDPQSIPASRIDWEVTPYNATYLIRVSPFISFPVIGGCDITYLLQVSQEPTSVTLKAMPITPTVDDCSVLTATVKQDEKLISGTLVTFTIVSGSGIVTPTAARTDASGQATATLSSTVPGIVTVKAQADSKSDTAVVTFTHGSVASVDLIPATETVTAGESVTYTLTAYDKFANPWDVTALGSYTITPAARGSWTANVYTSEKTGTWTVTGSYGGYSDTAMLTVTHDIANSVGLTPETQTVTAGESVTYTLTAYDQFANPWDVTALGSYTITPAARGSWTANVYTSEKAGTWTVTATYTNVRGIRLTHTATLTVKPGLADTVRLEANPMTLTVGKTAYLTATVEDACSNRVPTQTVVFTTTLGCLDGDGPAITKPTDINGIVTATLTSTGTGTATVTATAITASSPPKGVVYVKFTPVRIYIPLILKNYPPHCDLSPSIKAVDFTACQRGADLRYTITLSNTGNLAASVTLTDPIPNDTTFMLDSLTGENCTYDPTAKWVRCSPVSVGIGGSKTVSFKVQVGCLAGTVITNTVAINDGYLMVTRTATTTVKNRPPYVPSNPVPPDGAQDQPIDMDLSWSGGDPDAPCDTVAYDVYFGTTCPPSALICNDVSTPGCAPDTLDYNTTYYWYVVATDNRAESRGPEEGCWSFTTVPCWSPPLDPVPCPTPAAPKAWGPICSSESYKGLLCAAESGVEGKSQWYYMNITTRNVFTVDLTPPSGSDYDIYIYTADTLEEAIEKEKNKDRLCKSDNYGDVPEHAVCSPTRVGRHYIRVRCWANPNPNSPYTLHATFD